MIRNRCCLLIEDDPEDQEFFMQALREVSSTTGCYAVGNGAEALRALLQENVRPNYIFTDIHMPLMDGFEFLKELRGIEQFKDIPVIVYSSDSSVQQIQRTRTFGVTAFYSKARMDVLQEILRKYFPEPVGRQTVL